MTAASRDNTIRATLDRASLRYIARVGGGEYFEIGVAPDRDTAFRFSPLPGSTPRVRKSKNVSNRSTGTPC